MKRKNSLNSQEIQISNTQEIIVKMLIKSAVFFILLGVYFSWGTQRGIFLLILGIAILSFFGLFKVKIGETEIVLTRPSSTSNKFEKKGKEKGIEFKLSL